MILLSLSIPVLSGCEHLTIHNRFPCAVNGKISRGMTCSNTVGDPSPTQHTMDEAIQMIEEIPASDGVAYRAPAVIESAKDYGEETDELNVACRLLGKSCTYELQSSVKNRQEFLRRIGAR